ncbi:MAG: CheR family methyltransferase, partial [Leptolyngbyaceae bacterium]|nr:CheR family methyltransferase [Leptolyngbyaceae bacterium]
MKTIDVFFKSLAEDRKNRAIAILLSGSNNDGSAGIEAVRAAGGITIAQDPSTAEFTEMPRAAIATGSVDKVLDLWAIARELITISQHPYLYEPPPQTSEASSFGDEDLAPVFGLLQNKIGINFSTYRRTTFGRRLKRRMALHSISDLNDYIQYLHDHPSEVDALYRDVLISVTSFFRDKEVYQAVKERIIPSVWAYRSSAQPSQSIRLWVPGCASGEEVYSLAICLLEWKSQMNAAPSIQIFGTDINDRAIEEARLGIYRESRLENVSAERRRLFFTEVEGGYQIKKAVRELCIFARHDLGSDPPFSDLDVVSCRNVLIYFQSSLQQRVLSIFHYSLRASGFLILGNAESVGNTSELFSIEDSDAKIYTRKAVSSRLNLDFVNSSTIQQAAQNPRPFSTSWEN